MYEKAGLVVGIFQRESTNGTVEVQPVYLRQDGYAAAARLVRDSF